MTLVEKESHFQAGYYSVMKDDQTNKRFTITCTRNVLLLRKKVNANVFFLFSIIFDASGFYGSYDIERIWSSNPDHFHSEAQTEQKYAI